MQQADHLHLSALFGAVSRPYKQNKEKKKKYFLSGVRFPGSLLCGPACVYHDASSAFRSGALCSRLGRSSEKAPPRSPTLCVRRGDYSSLIAKFRTASRNSPKPGKFLFLGSRRAGFTFSLRAVLFAVYFTRPLVPATALPVALNRSRCLGMNTTR